MKYGSAQLYYIENTQSVSFSHQQTLLIVHTQRGYIDRPALAWPYMLLNTASQTSGQT